MVILYRSIGNRDRLILGGNRVKLIVKKDYESMSQEVANMVKNEIKKNPNLVLGLATGSTPKGLYKELVRMHREEGLDFSNIISFNLDEYIGIKEKDPSSYNYYMREYLFDHINIKDENAFIPPAKPTDLDRACEEYDDLIKGKGGIDLQILGVGENGHIAFNEPDKSLNLGTSIIELTEDTIEVNSRFFESIDEVPRSAISMGIGNIMSAKKIVMLVSGGNKAPIMKKILSEKKVSTEIPASILLLHQDVTFIITEDVLN